MTTQDKKVFIHDLIASVKHSLMEKVSRTPEEWNGLELRHWIAEAFERQTLPMTRKGRREYRNSVLVGNLD